jgi:hypothetical protein
MVSEKHIFAKISALNKSVLAILLSLIPFFSFAQPFTLTGSVNMNTDEVFTYKIVFTESQGSIKGYSITYDPPNETKAAITGTLDKAGRSLSFRETEIIYSHDVRTRAYMCLLDAKTEYVQSLKGKILQGALSGNEADRTACTGGTVTFAVPEEISLLFDRREQFDTIITMKKKAKETPVAVAQPPVAEQPMVTDKITKGTDKTYEWHSDTVIIDIWDGGVSDGDQVTIEYNGRTYLSKHVLSKQKKQLRLPVSPTGMDIITILADNEGWDPPNTATLMLTDGTTRHSVVSYNPKGQISVIKIKRVR